MWNAPIPFANAIALLHAASSWEDELLCSKLVSIGINVHNPQDVKFFIWLSAIT
ncbi:hypothetical protein G7B40_039240 [Aetokthonos hydrillicola Thurmond2011]|uniref:Uncharacterized protein n=1 Tax=Aetokthonos hydrillicola Thurmond2011 TaxID=2712845 RepID=A0AAP5IHU9_9CYAN|nr:hypothetical protein [Aetokthonos hydrillicola CCALA 1050]MBW4591165.1 hypothetical protein [Aetokthonos hydrillicola CCALA 1050]MDR9900538.1 hypothetical protein [Aetokthonos hydrillicola Thurmond2011]